jgi:hypothetical protein
VREVPQYDREALKRHADQMRDLARKLHEQHQPTLKAMLELARAA